MSSRNARPGRGRTISGLIVGAGLLVGVAGCVSPVETKLRRDLVAARAELDRQKQEVQRQQGVIAELNKQLAIARGLSDADLKLLYYPERIDIDPISGGADYDNAPGDDGVTVYIMPVDRDGDAIKSPGDITIQLYDLAAAAGKNLIGEYQVPVDQVGRLWHGKYLASHYVIKCPFPPGRFPDHEEITIRVVFVDYLTKRVLSAQATTKVELREGRDEATTRRSDGGDAR